MTARIGMALFIVSSFWACGGDSVTTSEPPALERGLHEVGSLTQPRYEHVATLMQNGKVLIGGGYKELIPSLTDVSNRHISAELFDPETGTSSPTGDTTVGRYSDRGILLPDGRVLIMPLHGRFPIEIYDPTSGGFTRVPFVPNNPFMETVTLLHSGKVFVTVVGHAGVFDPDARAFTSMFAMDYHHRGQTATLLKDGRVLIVGGRVWQGGGELVGRNLIYDPSPNAFTKAGDLQFDRSDHKAVLLQDGRVLIVGGYTSSESAVTAEMYDPETNTFSPAGVSAIQPNAALLLPSGRVFLIHRNNGDIVLYNPATHAFSPTGHSIGWRRGASVTLLEDGRVMIAGGLKSKDNSTQSGHGQEREREIVDQILIFTP